MKIIHSKQSQKYLKKSNTTTTKRLEDAILKLSLNPPVGDIKPIEGYENIYRARVGNLRIVFIIDENNNTINIIKILPRGDVYK